MAKGITSESGKQAPAGKEERLLGAETNNSGDPASQKTAKPTLRAQFFESIFDEDARRGPAILLGAVIVGMAFLLILNLSYSPAKAEVGSFSSLMHTQETYNRTVVPLGVMMCVAGILLFVIGRTYGEHTVLSVGKKSIEARSFFMKTSFYISLIGVAFIISGIVADYVSLLP